MKDRAFVSTANGAWAIVVSIALLGGFGCGSKTDSRAIYAHLKSMPVNTPDGSYRSSGKGVRRAGRQTGAMTMGVNHTYQGNSGDLMEPSAWSGGVAPAGTTKASGVFTLTSNAFSVGKVVVIDGKTFAFQAVLSGASDVVLIGATASESIDNLIAAINLGAGAGTLYGIDQKLHPTCSAVAGGGDTMDLTAKNFGAEENTIVTTETIVEGSWGAATLLGGTTNWDSDDVMVFDGTVTQEPAVLNTNLRGVVIAGVRTKRTFFVDVGTESSPLRIQLETDGLQAQGEGTVYFQPRAPETIAGQNNIFCDSENTRDAVVVSGTIDNQGSSHGIIEVKSGKAILRSGANRMVQASGDREHYLVTGPNSFLELEVAAGIGISRMIADNGATIISHIETPATCVIMDGSTLIQIGKIQDAIISSSSRVIYKFQESGEHSLGRNLLLLGQGDFSDLFDENVTVTIGPNGSVKLGPVTNVIDLRKDFPYGG